MIGNIKTRLLIVIGLVVFSLSLVGGVALAKNDNNGECKPGWGLGDDNHCHEGPPGGPSVHPVFPDGKE